MGTDTMSAARLSQDDYPEVGARRRGHILVCHGDDSPDQWIAWLEPIQSRFTELHGLSEEYGFALDAGEGSGYLGSVGKFLELIGVDVRSKPWEGSLISGVYRFGWVKVGTVRAVRKKAAELLKALQRQVDSEVRRKILEELAGIKDIDQLIERTAADRDELRRQILESKSALSKAEEDLRLTRDRLQQLEVCDSKQIDESCLRMAGAILRRAPCRMVAGPLVLWDDNVVYAITSRGGVTLPANSTPALLLGDLVAAGYPVVRVEEKTVIGGWTSGPIYRKGTPHITDWASVWSDRERKGRVFLVVPKDSERTVHEIHQALASGSSGASK
jgi:hypothetical protein